MKNGFLVISQNSQENNCARVSILIKLKAQAATLLKKRLWHTYFPVNFEKFLRTPIWNTFFTEQLWSTASTLFHFLLPVVNRVFVFSGLRPSVWPPILGPFPSNFYLPSLVPNLYLPALALNLYLPALAPNLYLSALAPNFYLPVLAYPEPGFAYTNLVPPICIYWAWPTICITVLWICMYLFICVNSSGSSNISNSSNSLD